MPGVNEAQAAGRCHNNVVLPLVRALRRRGTLVRIQFCTISAVDTPSAGYARVAFENGGGTSVLSYGIITPVVGLRWRCLDFGAGYVLDDQAVAA